MKIGILGTGIVGETIGAKLVALGHDVKISGRAAVNEKAGAWVAKVGGKASYGTFADAAAFGELVFHCTKGDGAVDAARAARAGLAGKILVDVTNPLDFSAGFPPTLFVSGRDSLGERIQREVPEAKVVKTLNTVNCNVMVDPSRLGADSDVFVSGDDAEAKAVVSRFLREQLGWREVTDLGDLTTARGTESYLLLWIRLMGALKTADFNIKLVRA
ncbi:MAG: NAD(P)-binding domain-containing protein [Labilithrix sp.]|nr:NAD(P)-binding domain-containing protein [Labilithrix sp.]